MPVHLIWEQSDGEIIKGLKDCSTPSATTKEMVDSDLNHGTGTPGSTTVPKVIGIRTFSWPNNGDANNPITDAALYLSAYYTTDPIYTADTNKYFCGNASTSVFGDYSDANGSHSASADYTTLINWGDSGAGVQVSLDRGRTYTSFATGTGDNIGNAISLAATSMDIGAVNGQLEPGDRSLIYLRINVPSTASDPSDAGVYLFLLGLTYNYTE